MCLEGEPGVVDCSNDGCVIGMTVTSIQLLISFCLGGVYGGRVRYLAPRLHQRPKELLESSSPSKILFLIFCLISVIIIAMYNLIFKLLDNYSFCQDCR